MWHAERMRTYVPDELAGHWQTSVTLGREDDGELAATLVRRGDQPRDARPAVLSLHGFSDYFFHDHVSAAFADAGYAFYALELRRYGRSLRPGNVPAQIQKITSYQAEIDWALKVIQSETSGPLFSLSHSTGGLAMAHYFASGSQGSAFHAAVMNSPFFQFPARDFEIAALRMALPLVRHIPGPSPMPLGATYTASLHKAHAGEWSFDLARKPIEGMPVTWAWLGAIADAQKQVQNGLGLKLPILVMHSSQSYPPLGPLVEAAHVSDAVLNVKHIQQIAPRLGSSVHLQAISQGRHDLFLSRQPARQEALSAALNFFRQYLPATSS
jgi:alpha-beta hydrolase superfamily lysophospholipase